MAIINCPACNKRISSVATQCEFCKTVFTNDGDEEKLIRMERNKRLDKIQRLQNFSFLFVMLFAAGVLLMYFGTNNQSVMMNNWGRVTLAFGFIGYIISRIMLLMSRRK